MALQSVFQHGVKNLEYRTVLLEWRKEVIEVVKNKIILLKVQNKIYHPTETSSFKTISVKISFQHIHDQFVAVPIDKVNGKIALICNRFYIEVLIKELEMVC